MPPVAAALFVFVGLGMTAFVGESFGVFVGSGVAVFVGRDVAVGSGVFVGGSSVLVGTAVAVGGTAVEVGGSVGITVGVADGADMPQPANNALDTTSIRQQRDTAFIWLLN